MAVLFISIALAYKIGEWVGGVFSGFAIVAGFYGIVAIAWWFVKDSMSQKVEENLKEILKQKKK